MRPYNEGRAAFKEGRLGNPYPQNTKNNRDWEHGFSRAYFENLERVRDREQAQGRRGKIQSSFQKETTPSRTEPAYS